MRSPGSTPGLGPKGEREECFTFLRVCCAQSWDRAAYILLGTADSSCKPLALWGKPQHPCPSWPLGAEVAAGTQRLGATRQKNL